MAYWRRWLKVSGSCIATIVTGIVAHAQSIEALTVKYPSEHAVFWERKRNVTIQENKGVIQAVTKESDVMAILNDRANGQYNRYTVYHGSYNELKSLEAYTNFNEGGKFRKMKVSEVKTQSSVSSGIFYDDVKESSFDFPSLTKGSFAVVNVEEFNKDAHLISPFYFSSYIPVENAVYTFTHPTNMEVKYIIKNDPDGVIKVNKDEGRRNTTLTFTASGLKYKDRYGAAPAAAYYEPHVIILIQNYTDDNGTKQPFLSSVDDLYRWNYSFIKNLDNNKEASLKKLSDSLTVNAKTDEEKARNIYTWVQAHIKYVAFEDGDGGFIPRRAADVCDKRYGDCKDMTSILTALMQLAGLKAYFTWIGTNDIPYDYTEVPSPITDNHMIAAVQLNGQWVFLDATDPHCIFGYPTDAIQNKQALIAINENKYELVRVSTMPATASKVIDSTFIHITPEGIKGNMVVHYNGYFGNELYDALMYKDSVGTADYVKYKLGKASNKFKVSTYEIIKANPLLREAIIKGNYEVPDYVKRAGNEIFINLNLEKFFNGPGIDTAKRMMALENDFHYTIEQYHILHLPQGYTASYIPKNFKAENDLLRFEITYEQKNNQVICHQTIQVKYILLQPNRFTDWNNIVKQLVAQYKEQVVLTKN
ncbi:MAG TPA: hypothetical protein DCQ29_14170 [Chitinophagaceae bacterium]|nr:hypothetical protein [Chitinophagaceae bacterium]